MLKPFYPLSLKLQAPDAEALDSLRRKKIRPIDIFRLGLAAMKENPPNPAPNPR